MSKQEREGTLHHPYSDTWWWHYYSLVIFFVAETRKLLKVDAKIDEAMNTARII